MKNAPADRVSHVCKSAVTWWGGRRALPRKRSWRRTRPVPGRGPFESVVGLRTKHLLLSERRVALPARSERGRAGPKRAKRATPPDPQQAKGGFASPERAGARPAKATEASVAPRSSPP